MRISFVREKTGHFRTLFLEGKLEMYAVTTSNLWQLCNAVKLSDLPSGGLPICSETEMLDNENSLLHIKTRTEEMSDAVRLSLIPVLPPRYRSVSVRPYELP